MEVMLQRHCARYIYVVPEGLRELMSDISREVLRMQPEDMYTFIADYMDALIITRENARVAARLVESLTQMAQITAAFLEETGMASEEVLVVVDSIQKIFRKNIENEMLEDEEEEGNIVAEVLGDAHIPPDKAEVAAEIIQQAYRRFKERREHEKKLLAGIVDWRVAARSAIALYRKTGVTNEEANRAATLIKAAYKGYFTRKMMKKIKEVHQQAEEANLQDITDYLMQGEDGELYEPDHIEYDAEGQMKSVTIDYSTVIPHVDFDTPDAGLTERKGSTASVVGKHAMDTVLGAAFSQMKSDERFHVLDEGDEDDTEG